MKPTEDAKMGNDEAERLIAAISSQIGDDVSVIFNHESLFKRSRDLLRTQAARIAELEALVAADFDMLDSTWKARAEAAEAALAEAEARGYARSVEDAAIICEALNDKRLSGASGDFIASLASQRIRALAQKEAGAVKGGTISTGPHCDCGMIGPCMFKKCRHPLAANNGEAGE